MTAAVLDRELIS